MASKVEGLDKLRTSIATLRRETVTEIETALRKSADEMASMARALAPVDEGDLRDSIQVVDGDHELQVRVVATDYKAGWVEHGVAHRPATPFFFPSYRAVRTRARSRISRAVNAAARKAFSS